MVLSRAEHFLAVGGQPILFYWERRCRAIGPLTSWLPLYLVCETAGVAESKGSSATTREDFKKLYLQTALNLLEIMLQSKAVAICLILLIGNILTESDAKAISKRHVRRDWMILPDAVAFYVYKAVDTVSPKTAEVLAKAVQTPIILETRNFLIQTTAQITVKAEEAWTKVVEKVSGFWQRQEKEPEQQ